MKIHVDEIPPEGLVVDLDEDGNLLFEKEQGLIFEEKIRSHLVLYRAGGSVVLNGNAQTRLLLGCSRCLERFPYDVDHSFSLEYRPLSEINDRGEIELAADELDVEFFSEGTIDLKDVAMGQVAEQIPFKPLCHEQCGGLCPNCGVNLNESNCDCANEAVDPRLAVLKDLLEKEENRPEK